MKATHQQRGALSSTINQHHHHNHHPWLTTLCVLCGLGIVVLAVFWIRRCKTSSIPRHEYHAVSVENTTAVRSSSGDTFPDSQHQAEELKTFQRYLGEESRYRLTGNLGQMGWRPNKQWFTVKDKHLDANRLLTLVDLPSCAPIKANSATRLILLDLFRSLHHPYILPILDIEFWNIGAALITPLNQYGGSLKDLIFHTSSNQFQHGQSFYDSYETKYMGRGKGLPYRQIQCLARQILEALSFLQSRNFPKFYHLHSGNVIVQNGVARLAALENTLFCLAAKAPDVCDALAFGHLLFEMTTGCELTEALRTSSTSILHRELEKVPQIADVIDLIFDPSSTTTTPSLDALIRHDMFKGVELRELCRTTGINYNTNTTSKGVADLLHFINEMHSGGTSKTIDTSNSATPPSSTSTASDDDDDEDDDEDDGIAMATRDVAQQRPLDFVDSEIDSEIDETLTVIIETTR